MLEKFGRQFDGILFEVVRKESIPDPFFIDDNSATVPNKRRITLFKYIIKCRSLGHHAKTIKKIFRLNYRSGVVRAAVHPIMGTLTGIAVFLVILYGGWQVIDGSRTAGDLMSFITALLLAYEPLKRLAGTFAGGRRDLRRDGT